MVKLRMNFCDEVNHGGVRYPVSNVDQTVEVPAHVAAVLLSVGAGATLAEPAEIVEPEGVAVFKDVSDPGAGFAWRGQSYVPDADGMIRGPAAAIPDMLSHGFVAIGPAD